MTKDQQTAARVIDTALGFLLFPLYLLFYGFVLAQLWAWFMVPLGVRPITLPMALGLSALIHATRPPATSDMKGDLPCLRTHASHFARISCLLGFGIIYISMVHAGWFR